MPKFEVTYEVEGKTDSKIIEAPDPVQAAKIFMEQNKKEGAIVLCVVRQ